MGTQSCTYEAYLLASQHNWFLSVTREEAEKKEGVVLVPVHRYQLEDRAIETGVLVYRDGVLRGSVKVGIRNLQNVVDEIKHLLRKE